ncbi:hypothetical protein TB2_003731 [Malus domestica]
MISTIYTYQQIRLILEALEHQIKLSFSSLGNLSLIAVIPASDKLFKSSTMSSEPLIECSLTNERVAGGADVEGGAIKVLEGELALANEGASITAGLGVKPPEYLDDQLTRRHVLIRSWPYIAP